jgi:NADPH:quinone reductase-like Zn-dependent oxidoreductase
MPRVLTRIAREEEQMQAVVLHEHGGPEKLILRSVAEPTPGEGEVLVRLEAISVNHLDLKIRRGTSGYPIALPRILGLEGAGRVAALGPGVASVEAGQRVLVLPWKRCHECFWCRQGLENLCARSRILGIHADGCYAELVSVPVEQLLPLPDGITPEQAAAIPTAMGTAWHAVHAVARVQPGESVLVMAATSGVGVALVQMVHQAGARVIAAGRDPSKLARLSEFGADAVVGYDDPDWIERVRQLTDGLGVDVVFEQVGGTTLPAALRSLRKRGRLVSYGASGGLAVAFEDWQFVYRNEFQILGATSCTREDVRQVLARVSEGKLRAVAESLFPLAEAPRAHQLLESRAHFGKVLLIPS